jgi:predicted AAA+ superfamily ATPase
VIEQILGRIDERNTYFWATHSGAELDLLTVAGGRRIGFEVKYADAPKLTKSMRIALADLKLDRLFVVYPGATGYRLATNVDVVPIARLPATLDAAGKR